MHRFQNTTKFTVHVTACDVQKSFSFKKTVKVRATRAFQFMCKHTVVNTCQISGGMRVRVRKVSKINIKSHSRSLVLMPFDRPHTISY